MIHGEQGFGIVLSLVRGEAIEMPQWRVHIGGVFRVRWVGRTHKMEREERYDGL
ncbi:MAG: hypothetical protein GXY48_13390 [Methanomicrobiales archaeon]|nr:hypothetical protein [Methanomicrobiales archaeon]